MLKLSKKTVTVGGVKYRVVEIPEEKMNCSYLVMADTYYPVFFEDKDHALVYYNRMKAEHGDWDVSIYHMVDSLDEVDLQ